VTLLDRTVGRALWAGINLLGRIARRIHSPRRKESHEHR
jgi:hypothetical protein